jgi:hypothetical protein
MAEFIIGKEISTEKPAIEVTITKDNPLSVGKHRFRLVVIDDAGNASKGDEVIVIVADKEAPTAILSAPTVVGVGETFALDGSASFDVGGGKVTQWLWTYVGPEK